MVSSWVNVGDVYEAGAVYDDREQNKEEQMV